MYETVSNCTIRVIAGPGGKKKMMNSRVCYREKSRMLKSPNGAHRTSTGEVEWVRPLTLRRKLYAFFRARDEGSQLVEMALVAPILLIILTGMASFGMALYSQQQLGLATANAAQAVATGASYVSNPCSAAATAVTTSLPGWAAGSFTYTISITMVTSTGTSSTRTDTWTGTSYPSGCTGTDLTDLNSTDAQFQPFTLKVSYPYSWFPIFNWARYGSSFTPSGNLQTTQAAMIQ
jgi:Flp pilus assembly protein TadG